MPPKVKRHMPKARPVRGNAAQLEEGIPPTAATTHRPLAAPSSGISDDGDIAIDVETLLVYYEAQEPEFATEQKVHKVIRCFKKKAKKIGSADWREMMYVAFTEQRGIDPREHYQQALDGVDAFDSDAIRLSLPNPQTQRREPSESHPDLPARPAEAADNLLPFVEEWVFNSADPRTRGASAAREVEQMADQLRARGGQYNDRDFPAAYSVLHRDRRRHPDPARASIFSQSRGGGSVEVQPISWHRPADIGQKADLKYSRDRYSDDDASDIRVTGAANIRRLVDDGTITDDTPIFFPFEAKGWHNVSRCWADCKHEFAGFSDGSLLHKGLSTVRPSDIKQGGLGDCYLLAACASIASLPESYMASDLILDHSDVGLYAVKFYVAGRWICVAIDDQFPCTVFNGCIHTCCAEPSDCGAIWAMIVEKAFAKLHGSFEAIKGGLTSDALNYLCGGDIEEFRNDEAGAERAWVALCARVPLPSAHDDEARSGDPALLRGFSGFSGSRQALAFFSGSVNEVAVAEANDRGLASKHAYSLLGAIELQGSRVKLVEIHDPHCECEWTGDYHAADRRWTPELKQEVLGHREAKIPPGSAFMTWDDYSRLFEGVNVCYPFPKARRLIRRESAVGRWEPGISAGGRHGHSTFRHNPAFACSTAGSAGDQAVEVKLTLSQPDKRSMLLRSGEQEGHEDMYLYCLDRAHYDKLCDPLWHERQHSQHLPEWVKETEEDLHLTGRLDQVDLKLVPGIDYVLVCCAWSPGISEPRPRDGFAAAAAAAAPPLRHHDWDFCITVDCGAATLQLTSLESQRDTDPEHRQEMATPRARAELCHICSGPFGPGESYLPTAVGKTHTGDCHHQHKERTAPKCLHCNAAVVDKFHSYSKDGHYNEEGDHKVHPECYEAYEATIGPKCLHCSLPVSRLASGYPYNDNEKYDQEGKHKVHSACHDDFNAARAAKCMQCGKPVVSGSSYPIGDDGKYQKGGKRKVHSECWEEYQEA